MFRWKRHQLKIDSDAVAAKYEDSAGAADPQVGLDTSGPVAHGVAPAFGQDSWASRGRFVVKCEDPSGLSASL